jgi:pimeloyl-ACP methyl ester carboxylesterase
VLQLMLSGMGSFEPASALAAYQGPVTCIVTERTVATSAKPAGCRSVVRLQGVSHWPMLDQPDRVSQVIEGALPRTH